MTNMRYAKDVCHSHQMNIIQYPEDTNTFSTKNALFQAEVYEVRVTQGSEVAARELQIRLLLLLVLPAIRVIRLFHLFT